jgi:hypothetical protein
MFLIKLGIIWQSVIRIDRLQLLFINWYSVELVIHTSIIFLLNSPSRQPMGSVALTTKY